MIYRWLNDSAYLLVLYFVAFAIVRAVLKRRRGTAPKADWAAFVVGWQMAVGFVIVVLRQPADRAPMAPLWAALFGIAVFTLLVIRPKPQSRPPPSPTPPDR